MWQTATAWPAARAAATAAGAFTSPAPTPPTNRRRISSAVFSSPRANARVRAMRARGRPSSGASASNSAKTRSAQSAAHAAARRRSASVSVCGDRIILTLRSRADQRKPRREVSDLQPVHRQLRFERYKSGAARTRTSVRRSTRCCPRPKMVTVGRTTVDSGDPLGGYRGGALGRTHEDHRRRGQATVAILRWRVSVCHRPYTSLLADPTGRSPAGLLDKLTCVINGCTYPALSVPSTRLVHLRAAFSREQLKTRRSGQQGVPYADRLLVGHQALRKDQHSHPRSTD
jgi:hypothetical protein